MNRQTRITPAAPSEHVGPCAVTTAASGARLPTLITADASKVSPAQFMDGVFGPGRMEALRAEVRAQCCQAILRGDTYGFPPVMVAECREMMASDLVPVEHLGVGRIAL